MSFGRTDEIRPRLSGQKRVAYRKLTKPEKRVLVIGDIHAPFTHPDYLEHCIRAYAEYNCNEVVFIGDIIDNHYASYHESDPDGLSAGDELDAAIAVVGKWRDAFPRATVIIGNHDRMVMRKAFSAGVPARWIRSYNSVLGTYWDWKHRHEIDGVQYVHGEGGTARTRVKNDMQSTVQGHIHTQAYVEWMSGHNQTLFAMQVGCGIDAQSYAMAYAKNFKASAICCGIVVGGHTAFNVMLSSRPENGTEQTKPLR